VGAAVVGGSVGGVVAGTGAGVTDATGVDVEVVGASSVTGAAGTTGVPAAGCTVALEVVADCVAMPIPSAVAATTLAAPTNARAPAAGRRRAARGRAGGGRLRFMSPSVRPGGSTNPHGTVRVVEELPGARCSGLDGRAGKALGVGPARETAQS
jgi:hypothetical protein